jgi:DNA (cytosine-5)-methyltransferase 1
MKKNKITFIDLFAGCGGLSEGFYKQGYEALAHVEMNHYACETIKTRLKHYDYKNVDQSVLEIDITDKSVLKKLEDIVNGKEVDIVIGGPPCQSFSSLGRAKDEHGMSNDPRNYLFESYVNILNKFKPKAFVFENVTGLLSAKINNELIIKKILKKLGEKYNVIYDPKIMVLNSADYGVPQIRKRVIIIGIRKDLKTSPEIVYKSIKKTHGDPELNKGNNLKDYVTVKQAISDLPKIRSGMGNKVVKFVSKIENDFLKQVRSKNEILLSDHVARTQNEGDTERFKLMSKNKWTFQELLINRPDLNHAKQRVFNNSYVVQFWNKPSRTIIAHLYKDGNQFIHPDHNQSRSITPREAARLQSFPDNFIFEGSRTEIYKQIGNAVPPLFAEAIAKAIKNIL